MKKETIIIGTISIFSIAGLNALYHHDNLLGPRKEDLESVQPIPDTTPSDSSAVRDSLNINDLAYRIQQGSAYTTR